MATASSLRELLRGTIDYAGLFPPAALDMAAAVRNYATYRADQDNWALGRFVVPAARLEELEHVLEEIPIRPSADPVRSSWRVTVLVGSDPMSDLARAEAFNARRAPAIGIDMLEMKLGSADGMGRLAAATRGRFALFVEIPLADDDASFAALSAAGAGAKIRTGGVTADAIPGSAAVAGFLRQCRDARLPFKATAGLHHPIRGEFALTYEATAARARMLGFLNLFLAASFVWTGGCSDRDVIALLDCGDAGSMRFTDEGVVWRGHRLSTEHLRDARARFVHSFGSCSFREPLDDLRTLALL